MDIEFVSESYARVNKTPKRKSSSKRKGSSGRGGHSEAHKAAISEGLRRYYAGKGKKKTTKSSTSKTASKVKPKTSPKKTPKTRKALENQKYSIPRGIEATKAAHAEEKVKFAELEKKTGPLFDKKFDLQQKFRKIGRNHLSKDGIFVNRRSANKDPNFKAAEKALNDFEKKHKKDFDEYFKSRNRLDKLKSAVKDKTREKSDREYLNRTRKEAHEKYMRSW